MKGGAYLLTQRKNEEACCTYGVNIPPEYIYRIVRNLNTGVYVLEKKENGKWTKTKHKSESPVNLEKYIWKE